MSFDGFLSLKAIFAYFALFLAYKWLASVFTYWKRKGVPQSRPSLLFGDVKDVVLMRKNLAEIYKNIYEENKDVKYVYMYSFWTPNLIVRDPSLVKDIMVKDFGRFHDNDLLFDGDEKSILARNPFLLKGNEWKTVRNQLTPCFSSGKVKSVFPLIDEVGRKFVKFIEKEQMAEDGAGLDVKEICSKYTSENIASCAFGLEGNCFEDSKAQFREIGRSIVSPSLKTTLYFMLFFLFPSLSKVLKLSLFPEKVAAPLRKIVTDTLKYREENNVRRNDFLDLMNDLKKKPGNEDFTVRDITSVLQNHGGVLSYEAIQDMQYLDCVLNESLRKHPPAMFLKKLCTQQSAIANPKGSGDDIVLEPGTSIVIPILALHRDPEYYPDPQRYDPGRFSSERRGELVKGAFLPFGDGPRVCIGQRFAILQVKIGIIHVVSNFELRVNKRMKRPVEVDPTYFLYAFKGGVWLNFHKIGGKAYENKNVKYVGMYSFWTPNLIVRDPNLVKDIMVKDFGRFHDNDLLINTDEESIIARNPFFLKGDEWKTVRNQLTPCFSSSKVKSVFPLIDEVGRKFVKFIEREQMADDGVGLDVKEICSKYTTENIASCAFGLEGNCFEDPKAEFREIGRAILSPSLKSAILFMLLFLFPSLSKMLRISLFPEKVVAPLRKIVTDTLRYREENNVRRDDFLDLMNDLKNKPDNEDFTIKDIQGHAAGFFIDGFETSSVALTGAFFDLADNPDVQTKLREEISSVIQKHGGVLSYEAIQDMTYLDCVLNESLRKHPPNMFMKKQCTQRTVLANPEGSGEDIVLEPGTSIVIPVLALHRDPEHYPDPQRYDPERFSSERRGDLVKGAFLPFGDGPRVCIGQRFAILQVKMGIIHVVRNFEMRVNKRMKTPVEVDPTYFLYAFKGGVWLNFHKIGGKA